MSNVDADPTSPQPQPDHAWKALALVNEWIRHAEAKLTATLASAGVTSGVLFALWRGWGDAAWPSVALGFLASVGLLVAGGCAASGLLPQRDVESAVARVRARITDEKPRTQRPLVNQEPAAGEEPVEFSEELVNLLFYSTISRTYADREPEYREVLTALTGDPTALTAHIAQQVWANAGVAERKFDRANQALAWLMASWVLMGCLAYLRVCGF